MEISNLILRTKDYEKSYQIERDPEPLSSAQIEMIKPFVAYQFLETPDGPLIHLITEWSKGELMLFRDKLTDLISEMDTKTT